MLRSITLALAILVAAGATAGAQCDRPNRYSLLLRDSSVPGERPFVVASRAP
jgi:hypothetical protein